jgi:hypothetical protein
MLAGLVDEVPDRELRLFAVRCCRRVSRFLSSHWRKGIDVAERFARGESSRDKLLATLRALTIDFQEVIESDNGEIYAAKQAVLAALSPQSPFDPRDAVRAASRSMGAFEDTEEAERAEQDWQADAIRATFTAVKRCDGGAS